METEQSEEFVPNTFQYAPLSNNDTLVFEKYKKNIDEKIRETFPSIPPDFQLKPVSVLRIAACGTIYHYKVALPDKTFAKVSFLTGGMYMPPPGVKDFQPPEPTFTVDPTTTSTPDD